MTETDAAAAAAEPEILEVESQPTAVMAGVVPVEELAPFYDRTFSTIPGVLESQGVSVTGPAFGRYNAPPGQVFDLEAGFPVSGEVQTEGDVRSSTLPGGRIARLVHVGSFDGLGESWGRLAAWIGERGFTPSGVFWEVYVTEPSPDMDPADLRTELNWLLEP